MAELFKFRCYQCQKLIGAPASKFGKVVNCPRCRVELIVPSPDDQEPPPEPTDPDAFRPEDLGISLEPEPLVKPKIAQTSQTPQEPVGPDPIAFLQQVAEAGEAPGDELPDEAKDSNGEVPDEPNADVLPEPAVEPLVARSRKRGASTLLEPSIRARDVILPRTAAVAWSLFAILALAFAFTSGLFVGHVLWK